MSKLKTIKHHIENVHLYDFDELALEVFRYQATYNPIYRQFVGLLGVSPSSVTNIADIPFLPITLFKKYLIQTGKWQPEVVFTSSGTTAQSPSRHAFPSLSEYLSNARKGFEHFYGRLDQYCIQALLPAYLERTGSSLVAMVNDFIQQSPYAESGFYLYDYQRLAGQLQSLKAQNIPTLLIGVSFALWDFAEQFPMDLSSTLIMETGGMKGRREEITRNALHNILNTAFQTQQIHSEYGMTELCSQAYSKGDGLFLCAPTMQVFIREVTDPFAAVSNGKAGVINIIDLANVNSCAFIATEDLGRKYNDGSFEVLGRLDSSDLRGCNLLVYN